MASTRPSSRSPSPERCSAVTAALGLTLCDRRNASLHRDVAREAATQADVAATARPATRLPRGSQSSSGSNTPVQSDNRDARVCARAPRRSARLRGCRRQTRHARSTPRSPCGQLPRAKSQDYSFCRRQAVLPNDSAAVLSRRQASTSSARRRGDRGHRPQAIVASSLVVGVDHHQRSACASSWRRCLVVAPLIIGASVGVARMSSPAARSNPSAA